MTKKRRRRHDEPRYMPSPAEIAEKAAEIRARNDAAGINNRVARPLPVRPLVVPDPMGYGRADESFYPVD